VATETSTRISHQIAVDEELTLVLRWTRLASTGSLDLNVRARTVWREQVSPRYLSGSDALGPRRATSRRPTI